MEDKTCALDCDGGESTDGWSDTSRVIRQFHSLADVTATGYEETSEPAVGPAPSTWGPLEIVSEIGSGGYGAVYLAWESELQRTVALKILHFSDCSSAVHEGRMLALAEHPNVVRVLGAGEHDGLAGLWMEFICGVTLTQFLKRNGALSAQEAGNIVICVCQAVAAVHRAGLVHRDIKVHNVMREDRTGRIVLMDFGSAAVREDDPCSVADLVGTPLYIAPELLAGAPATIASDVYSLGVVLYHLVTLTYPVHCETLGSAKEPCNYGPFVPLLDRRLDLPAAFVRVVSRALAREPGDRYESVGAMQEDLIRAMSWNVLVREPVSRRDAIKDVRSRRSGLRTVRTHRREAGTGISSRESTRRSAAGSVRADMVAEGIA